jgi:hypothetical protein
MFVFTWGEPGCSTGVFAFGGLLLRICCCLPRMCVRSQGCTTSLSFRMYEVFYFISTNLGICFTINLRFNNCSLWMVLSGHYVKEVDVNLAQLRRFSTSSVDCLILLFGCAHSDGQPAEQTTIATVSWEPLVASWRSGLLCWFHGSGFPILVSLLAGDNALLRPKYRDLVPQNNDPSGWRATGARWQDIRTRLSDFWRVACSLDLWAPSRIWLCSLFTVMTEIHTSFVDWFFYLNLVDSVVFMFPLCSFIWNDLWWKWAIF